MVDASLFFALKTTGPFIYRFFLPLILSPLGIDFSTCLTNLNFPIKSCADVAAFIIDSAALIISCIMLLLAFRNISAKKYCKLFVQNLWLLYFFV